QEIALIQTYRAFEGIRRSLRHELLEEDGVYINPGEAQDDGVAVDLQAGRVHPGKRSAKGEQGLAKPTARLALGQMAPEQDGEWVAGMDPGGGHCKIRKQRLSMAGSQGEGGARGKAALGPAGEGESQPPHVSSACPSIA